MLIPEPATPAGQLEKVAPAQGRVPVSPGQRFPPSGLIYFSPSIELAIGLHAGGACPTASGLAWYGSKRCSLQTEICLECST